MTHLQQRTDEELVAMYASGNNGAFDVLLERYKDKLYSYILYIVHNNDVADDLFQDTFVRAIMTIRQGRYAENGRFYAWLTRIAHNLIVDQFRNERTENVVETSDPQKDILNNLRLADASIEQQMLDEQTSDDVRRLVRHLPDSQREVVNMRYYEGLSFKEISERTGVSINTALGRMRYAIINMRRMADEHGIELYMA
ncbi:MAG: sigma-70 family RNA polymerase sigma factor [Alloprevotella sp.]|nr:sigma-70 family RNA polymerase sigma factor [Alloprevotella sp.]MBR1652112.1 sigma-70 family RNA polymerase sigma factor [Alloprevotella sp.]MBR1653317.1 sigma-70 family RNA polymerase sigma factor [Alloprevotella sp.]